MAAQEARLRKESLESLSAIVGPAYVHTDLPYRIIYSRAVGPLEFKRTMLHDLSRAPATVVEPGQTQEVVEILKLANRSGFAVVPYGGGSGLVEGTSLGGSVIVAMKRMDSVNVNAQNMTVTVGAGVIGRHLEEVLNRRGFTSGHFPQSMNSATVGGYVATAAIGTFSGRYGKMEDLVVGLEAVLPTGDLLVIPPIPRRSVGPHLEALLVGSEGSLCIITHVTLKIFALPETRKWVCCTLSDTPTGLRVIRDLMFRQVAPALVRLYDEYESAARIEKFSLKKGASLLILSFEGPKGIVAWQTSEARTILEAGGATIVSDAVALDWYRYRFDTTNLLLPNQRPGGVADSLEVAATWESIEPLWRSMRAALSPLAHTVHVHFSHVYDNECAAYVIFQADSQIGTPETAMELYRNCLSAAMEACLKVGGVISHHHGVGRTKGPWMERQLGDGGWRLLNELKRFMDPNNVLNPGSFGISQ